MVKPENLLGQERFQNISVTAWENKTKDGKKAYKTIVIDMSFPTAETKDLAQSERKYVHKKVQISRNQLAGLIEALKKLDAEVSQ